MKNLYALNEHGDLININDVGKDHFEKYSCIQCGDVLIPKKGQINRHHFSHKSKLECNYETYLHKLGKIFFFNLYKNCIDHKIPFYTDYEVIKICNTCDTNENFNLNCYLKSDPGKIDLTTIFDQIYLEKKHDDFIADILLKSSKRKEVIFIEIWVTHQCESEKIKSGNRIIEIQLKNEEDLNFLKEKYIHNYISNCRFYNFKTPTVKKNFVHINDCHEIIDLFTIYKSGKAISREILRKNLEKELQNPNVLYTKIENKEYSNTLSNNFISNIEEASRKGIKVKNCFACRFWAQNTMYDLGAIIFCKRNKALVENSNYGFNCDKFWRIE